MNQSCHHAVDYVRGTSTAEKEPCDETSVKEDHKASLDSSPGEHKTEPKEKSPVHNWFGYVAEEVKEDAKYLQKKAGKIEICSFFKLIIIYFISFPT